MFGRTSAGIMSRFIIFWKSLINISDLEQKFDFYTYEIPLKKIMTKKKVHQNIEIFFKFTWKILNKLIGPRTKIIREFPLNLICVYFKGKSLLFFSKKSTFRLIFEKCRRSSVILKIVGATPQLDQNINPQDICPDNFSFVYKYIWV